MTNEIHVFDDGIKLTEEQRLGNLLDEWQGKYFALYNEKENLLCEIERLKAELDDAHLSIEILEESAKTTEEILAHEISSLRAELAQRDARIAFLEELRSKLDSRCEELWDHILEKEEGNG